MASIGGYRAVGSPATDTGRYQHSACTYTETFAKGHILALCSNRSCPNKGANWVLQEITATVAPAPGAWMPGPCPSKTREQKRASSDWPSSSCALFFLFEARAE